MKPATPNKLRRIAILERALAGICACNVKWSFALTDEPQMKWLIKKGYIKLVRSPYVGMRKTVTMAEITDDGRHYLAENWK